MCPSETLTWITKPSESTPSAGDVQVVDAVLVLLNVPCCTGEVWVQEMVSGSPSGSLAVMDSVTTCPATGIEGETEMFAETFGGRFTVMCVTETWQDPVVDPPCPSVMATSKVNTVFAATAGAVQVGFRMVRVLKVPCGVAGDVCVHAYPSESPSGSSAVTESSVTPPSAMGVEAGAAGTVISGS